MDQPTQIVSNVCSALPKLRAISSFGAKVKLSDGKEYIDLMNGKGSVTLGHHHPVVDSAIIEHLQSCTGSATCWSAIHELLAIRLIDDLGMGPDVKVAFFSTGTEACRAAVDVARKHTGKRLVVSAGYHGWGESWARSDAFLEGNENDVVDFYFIPDLLEQVLARHRGRIALVILSPDYIHLSPNTLLQLAMMAKAEGVLLCCDDVKQGYRAIRASRFVQTTGFHADLYTFSKGLSNGHRLSCLMGKPEIMAAAAELTYTAYFDAIPFVAALATLRYMEACDGYQRLVDCGTTLVFEMRNIIQRQETPIVIYGDGPLFQFVGADDAIESALYTNCAAAGLLLYEGDNQAVSLATSGVMDELLARFEIALTATTKRFARGDRVSVNAQRRFEAAFRMIDGASDNLSTDELISRVRGIR